MTEHRPDEATPAAPESATAPASQARSTPDGDIRRTLYMAAAYVLRYPDDALRQVLPEIASSLRALGDLAPAGLLLQTARTLAERDPFELAAQYVATFDLDEPAALYLTAHEFGDSRQRGPALLALRQMLRAGGFAPVDGELPDYLPLLLEFLAHVPADGDTDGLEQRLAAVSDRIRRRLTQDSCYEPVFRALLVLLPAIPPGDDDSRFPQREHADTGVMPYPLRYE